MEQTWKDWFWLLDYSIDPGMTVVGNSIYLNPSNTVILSASEESLVGRVQILR